LGVVQLGVVDKVFNINCVAFLEFGEFGALLEFGEFGDGIVLT